jgi:hypothetical protein
MEKLIIKKFTYDVNIVHNVNTLYNITKYLKIIILCD